MAVQSFLWAVFILIRADWRMMFAVKDQAGCLCLLLFNTQSLAMQVRWILSTCRSHIVELDAAEQIPGMNGVPLTASCSYAF